MKKKLLIIISCLLLITGCDSGKKQNQGKEAMKRTQGPVPVATFTANMTDELITLRYPARIVSDQSVDIIAKVPGTLIKQYFNPGDFVKKGDILFLIEPDKYEAAYEVAKANLALSKANFERARLDYNRAIKLNKTKSISQKDFDTAVANFKSAEASIKSSEALLKNAEVDLNYTKVIAPFDGILGDKYQDEGAYVGPQNPNLIRLTKLNPIYAKFAIADVDALRINSKTQNNEWVQKETFTKFYVKDMEFDGKTIFIDKVINQKTGSVDAKAIFDNNDSKLLPGSFGTVAMSGLYQKDGFKIPQIAVQQDAINTFVYVIENNATTKKIVDIVFQTSEFAIISKGLTNGDKIIIDNFMKIAPGVPVKEIEVK